MLLEDWKYRMAFEGANNCLKVNIRYLMAIVFCIKKLLELKEVELRERSKQHSIDLCNSFLAFFAYLGLWNDQIYVFVRENLFSFQVLIIFLLDDRGRRHNKTCVDHVVRILELVYVLDEVYLLHRVEIKDHAVVALSYLHQVRIELHWLCWDTLQCGEVGFGDFGHLNCLLMNGVLYGWFFDEHRDVEFFTFIALPTDVLLFSFVHCTISKFRHPDITPVALPMTQVVAYKTILGILHKIVFPGFIRAME